MDPRQYPQAQAAIFVPESAEGIRMLPNGFRRREGEGTHKSILHAEILRISACKCFLPVTFCKGFLRPYKPREGVHKPLHGVLCASVGKWKWTDGA